MTTIINTPGNNNGDGGAAGIIIGVIIVIVIIVLFFVYALPAIRGTHKAADTTTINVQVPNPMGDASAN
jgi:hypothetical protein